MMSISTAMKGLLDKEWRHSRGYLLVTLLLIIYVPVIKTIFSLLQGETALVQWGQELNYALQFGTSHIQMCPSGYSGLLEWLPYMGSAFLGIIVLGAEKRGSLQLLVSMPVSRRQIILAKFFSGAATILLAMLINCLFLIGLNWLHSMPFSSLDILNWGLLAGAVCLGYFTMALMVSTFTAGVLAPGVLVFLFGIMLPGMLSAMIENIAARYFAVSQAVSIRIYTIGSYFNLHNYISRSDRYITHIDHYYSNFTTITGIASNSANRPDYLMESCLLLVGVLLLLVLAVMIFERVSLSAGGPIFSSSRVRKAGLGLGATYIASILVLPRAETLLAFSIYMVILTGLICTGVDILYRSRRHGWRIFGRRQTGR